MNFKLIGGILIISLITACYPNQGSTIEELDLVVTYHNEVVDFSNYTTYIVADTVVYISADKDKTLKPDAEQALIDKVDNSLMAYGWTRENDPATNGSDVAVLISILELENVSISTAWWDYWGAWGGWGYYPPYGGGYYPGYPGYCCYTAVYSYTTGTVIIEIVDPNNPSNENDFNPDPIPILWLGMIDGLAEGSRQNVKARINNGIDIMFEESPYLKK